MLLEVRTPELQRLIFTKGAHGHGYGDVPAAAYNMYRFTWLEKSLSETDDESEQVEVLKYLGKVI